MNMGRTNFLVASQTPPAGWILFGVGLLSLCGAIWLWQQHGAELAAADSVARAAAERYQAQVLQKTKASTTPGYRRRRAADAELRRGWPQALQAVDAATAPPVYLLALSLQPLNGVLRLEGEAPNLDEAMSYVQRLENEPAMKSAFIAAHDQVASSGSGAAIVRFSAVAEWR